MTRHESGKGTHIEGTLFDIIADTCILVNSVYEALKRQSDDAGRFYRAFIENAFGKIVFKPSFGSEEEQDRQAREIGEALFKAMQEGAHE